MSENKRKYQNNSVSGNNEMDLAAVLAMLSILEQKSREVGAISVEIGLEQLRKTIARHNVNKKRIRAAQAKLEKYQEQITSVQKREKLK